MSDATMRVAKIVLEGMRTARNNALDGAIEICEDLARCEYDARRCVRELRSLKDAMNSSDVDAKIQQAAARL